ncbi:hypothetical protein BDQ17DRAFT_1371704 [Cyathus striatus]|nr:hypothetical protein BDQ17DRAFT_1371704 [Cyathus striatus]
MTTSQMDTTGGIGILMKRARIMNLVLLFLSRIVLLWLLLLRYLHLRIVMLSIHLVELSLVVLRELFRIFLVFPRRILGIQTGGEMQPGTLSYDSVSLSVASEELDERTPVVRSPPVGRSFPPLPPVESPVVPAVEQEVLNEEEGDPIDPDFHSPSRQASSANLRSTAQGQGNTAPSPVSPAPVEEEEEEKTGQA